MIISPKAIDELKRNNKLKALLAIAHGRTVYTIDRWIRDKKSKSIEHLTTAVTIHMDLITKETGFHKDDILVDNHLANNV